MFSEFKQHIKDAHPYLFKGRSLLAISGGLDSVVLCFLLKQIDCDIALAHCDFSLRNSESDEDADFVRHLAETAGLVLHVQKFDTSSYAKEKKISTQMAARELRYRWFDEFIKEHGYDYVLTAHHADDDLETFLINTARGTGLRGLTGIPKRNEQIVRPLLPFSRERIENYAKKKALHWREDSSNASLKYLRNALRHNVVPSFKEAAPQVLEQLQKTQKHLGESQSLIDDYLALIYNLVVAETPEGCTLHIAKLNELPNTSALLYELLHPFGFTAWDDIRDLLTAQTGKQVLSASHRLIKNRDHLLLTERPETSGKPSEEEKETFLVEKETHLIDRPLRMSFHTAEEVKDQGKNVIFVDENLLQYPLELRRYRQGDVFQPFGMTGKKKLSKFFKDEKLSLASKENIWLLCSESKIVWIVDHRMDDHYKVRTETTQILKIETQ